MAKGRGPHRPHLMGIKRRPKEIKKRLLLGIDGIVLQRPADSFWENLAEEYSLDSKKTLSWYKEEAYCPYWSGKWDSLHMFWQLQLLFPERDLPVQRLVKEWAQAHRPVESYLPFLCEWAKRGDVYLLGDYKEELQSAAAPLPESLLCKSKMMLSSGPVCFTMSQDEYWLYIRDNLRGAETPILYIDASQDNLDKATSYLPDLQTVLSQDSLWPLRVGRFLQL